MWSHVGQEAVTETEHDRRSFLDQPLGYVKTKSICEAVHDVEDRGDVEGVLDRSIGQPRGSGGADVIWAQFVRTQCELLDQNQRRLNPSSNGRVDSLGQYRFNNRRIQSDRRDRAVGLRSERTLIELGGISREELAFPYRPGRRPPHDLMNDRCEPVPEESGPVHECLESVPYATSHDR